MISTKLLDLKQRLSSILEYFDKSRRCIYVDYPLHTNVGDLLINLGTERFFQEQSLNIWRRYNYYDFPARIPGLRDSDVLLLHGGGNMGDIWFNFQAFRESILTRYHRHRIIFLPQTLYFQSSEKEAASIKSMSGHKNLHVFARDFVSLEKLKRGGLQCVTAMPDMAHALAGILQPICNRSPGTLQLIRLDKEASEAPPALANAAGDRIDWDSGAFSRSRRLIHTLVVNTVKGVGRYGPSADLHRLWYWHRDHLISDAIRLFSRYERLITNRLHAMLLGLLLGQDVTAFDNSYGKLSSYHSAWLLGIENLLFYEQRKSASSATGSFSASV